MRSAAKSPLLDPQLSRKGSGSGSGSGSGGDATPSGTTAFPGQSHSSTSSSSSHPWASILAGGGGSINQIPPTPGAIFPSGTFQTGENDNFNLSRTSIPMRMPSVSTSGSNPYLEAQSQRPGSVAMPSRGMSLSLPGIASNLTSGRVNFTDDTENFKGLSPLQLREMMVEESQSCSSGSTSQSGFTTSSSSSSSSSTSNSTSNSICPAENILILDIRPSTSYQLSRIPGSVNICAPSTLLKRAGIGVERLEEEMLSCEVDRRIFSNWRKGKKKEDPSKVGEAKKGEEKHRAVVVLDASTSNLSAPGAPASGGGGKCLAGLLKKFDLAGYDGELYFLEGGFGAWSSWSEKVSSSSDGGAESLIEQGPRDLGEESDEEEEEPEGNMLQPSINSTTSNLKPSLPPGSIPSISFPAPPSQETSDSNPIKPSLIRSDSGKRRASAPSPTSTFQNPFTSLSNSSNLDSMDLKIPGQATSKAKKGGRHHSLVQPRGLPLEAFSVLSTTNAGGNIAGLKTPGVGAGGWGASNTGARTGGTAGGKSASVSKEKQRLFFPFHLADQPTLFQSSVLLSLASYFVCQSFLRQHSTE